MVKSLSAAEKNCLHKLSHRYSSTKKPQHIQLLEILENDESSSEEFVRKKLKLKNQSQLSLVKKKLLEEILVSLAFMHKEEFNKQELDDTTIAISILLDRKIWHSAHKLIAKEKKEAWQRQLLKKYYSILEQELVYLQFNISKGLKSALQEQINTIAEAKKNAFEYEQLKDILARAVTLRNHANTSITEGQAHEALVEKELLQALKPGDKSAPINQIIYETALSTVNYLGQFYDECVDNCKKLAALWGKHKDIYESHPRVLRSGAFTTFYVFFFHHKPELVLRYYRAYNKIATSTKNERDLRIWEVIRFHTFLKYYHGTADYGKVESLIKKDEKAILNTSMEYIPPNEALVIITSIAISFFVLGNYNKAEEYIYHIREINKNINRQDIFYFELIFHLIILYEKKDWYFLHTATEAAYQKLYKTKNMRPFEKELILFLRKLPRYRFGKESLDVMQDFLQQLDKYQNDPVKKHYFLYFNYYGWLKSKVEGISYTLYMRQQLATA